MARFILLLTLALFTSSCMRTVTLNTMRPAAINVPNNIQSLVLVDRTYAENRTLGIIEGILTGEGLNEKRDGVMAMFISLQNNLRNSPRYQIKIADENLATNSILGSFPEPLGWNEVNRLSNKYGVDALLVVELFDIKFLVTDGRRKKIRKVKDKDGKEIEQEFTEFYAEGVGTARIGVRLYDPKQRTIVDQDIFTQNRTWEATGTSIRDALAALAQKSEATKYLGSSVGASYAGKIAPMPIRISRNYYHKPKRNAFISKGARQARVNQWENAIDTWKSGINRSDDAKALGRMAYNIALGYEVMGDLYSANEWAGKSYIDYGEKRGQAYARQLSNRMFNEEILNEQMSLPEPQQVDSKESKATSATPAEATKDKNENPSGVKKKIELKVDN